MLRSISIKAAIAALATTGFAHAAVAEGETVNVDVQVDVAALTDAEAAEAALRDVERQARKACRYIQPATQLKLTDWSCVAEIIEQTVTTVDTPQFSAVYNQSERMIQIAARAEGETLLP